MNRFIGIAAVVFLAVASLAGLAAKTNDTANDAAGQRAFEREVTTLQAEIEARWLAHEQVLRGGRALFESSENVTREEWKTYVQGLELPETYPGIQGVGWSIVVPHDQRAEHEAHYGAEVRPLGIENYDIHPVPGNEHRDDRLTSIIYLEPLDIRNIRAIGLDMWSENNRNSAMATAEATGKPALSGKILLVQEFEENQQPGFLLYVPLYGNAEGPTREPTGDLIGWVYSPFRAGDLMTGILEGNALDITFEVYDGTKATADALLFDEDGAISVDDPVEPRWRTDLVLPLAEHQWLVRYESTPGFEAAQASDVPALILGSGLVAGALLAGVLLSLGRTHDAARKLAMQMTAELRESEAERASLNERLMASNQDLLQFAHIASHDLQEPSRTVQGILGLLETRKREALDDEAKELIGIAKDASARMRALVTDLLDYSRVISDESPPQPSVVEDAVRAAWTDVQVLAKETNAHLEVEGTGRVLATETEVTRIMLNLFHNSIKYRRGDSAHIKVRIRRVEENPPMVRIEVEDDGIGIPAEHHEKVFAMYARLHSQAEYEGTGMGLAICRKMVEKRRGQIGIASQQGAGTTVWFTLPAADGGQP